MVKCFHVRILYQALLTFKCFPCLYMYVLKLLVKTVLVKVLLSLKQVDMQKCIQFNNYLPGYLHSECLHSQSRHTALAVEMPPHFQHH